MKRLIPTLSVLFLVLFIQPANVLADGIFVVPKFVWDKHKDINEPTQKAIIIYDAGKEDLILQVKYEGPVDQFGWLIPVPNVPTVKNGSMKCFYELSQFTQQRWNPQWGTDGMSSKGRWFSSATASLSAAAAPPPVKVVEIKTVGAYEIAVLSARDSSALEKWLDDNHFYFPPEKKDVIDSYVKQHWDFVAVKINLSGWFSGFSSTASQLASGELSPLQISFAADRCVFPLKISSVNGKPSEVEVYVLSPEPLMERGMLEKKLPQMYRDDVERAKKSAAMMEQMQMNSMRMRMRFMGGPDSATPPTLPMAMQQAIERRSQTPAANPDEVLPYAKVTETDLPDCCQWIPRLTGKSWWLTKQTWTFQPAEMRDLFFDPALPWFTDELGTQYGYYAVASLSQFGDDVVPAILAAMQSTNPATRVSAASIFNRGYGALRDASFTAAAPGWLKDSEPQVRMAGIEVLAEYGSWNTNFIEPLIAMLRDPDAGVRNSVCFALPRFSGDLEPYLPELAQLLNDSNPDIQFSGIQILSRLGCEVPLENLFTALKSTNLETVAVAYSQVKRQREKLTDDQALVLLQSPEPTVRNFGLDALCQNPEKQSVELALPFLKDPDEFVRLKAAQSLQVLTGQPFNSDQPDVWIKWWDENKANFVAQSPADALELPDGGAYHDRGCEYYDMRNFAGALADFRKSCELGSEVQDYSYYRIWLIRARSGEEAAATQELAAYLKTRKAQNPPDWPLQVGRFLAGQITEADLLHAAVASDGQTDHQQHCEAYFYAGSKRLVENDRAGAVLFFKKCLATQVTTFEEFHSAQAELRIMLGRPTAFNAPGV